jgi:phosphoglycolate phosphatase
VSAFPLKVSGIIIDLDGTLLDTIPDLAAAANAMLVELERSALDIALIRSFVGKGLSNLVERTLTASFDRAPDQTLMARAQPVFERHYVELNGRHTTMYPGVKQGLDRLRSAGFPLACVTNKSGRYTLPLLAQVGLAPYFRTVVFGDTLEVKKPHPAPLLHACAALEIEPRLTLMIGDSLNDTQAARAAGCPVICVTYGYNEGHDVRELDHDGLVDSLVEAVGLIERA